MENSRVQRTAKWCVRKVNYRSHLVWRFRSVTVRVIFILTIKKGEGKGSPMTHKGRRGAAGFYARHFSLNPTFDGGAYLLSIPSLPSPPPRRATTKYGLVESRMPPRIEPGLPDSKSGVLTTTRSGTKIIMKYSVLKKCQRCGVKCTDDEWNKIWVSVDLLKNIQRLRWMQTNNTRHKTSILNENDSQKTRSSFGSNPWWILEYRIWIHAMSTKFDTISGRIRCMAKLK